MAEIIRMPRLSDTMEEGNIIGWQKKVGDAVSPGDILAEVETDKATMDLESFQSGTLLYIGVESGPVPVDGILAVIGEKGEAYEDLLTAENGKEEKSTGSEAKSDDSSTSSTEVTQDTPVSAQQELVIPQEEPGRLKASPLAKRLAEESGVDIRMVQGSGGQGRIIKRDIQEFLSNPSNTSSIPAIEQRQELTPEIAYGDHPVSQMRKIIAKRLGESKFSAPHFYLTCEVDMGNAWDARKKMNEMADPDKVSFNDLVVKAAAMALKKNPRVNASWFGDKITFHRDVHIGVAVAVEDGLLVPVIKDTDRKSLLMLNKEIKELAGLAKSRKLAPEQMQGNTFTISNLGMFGIEEFTAIINPPDACILAVGGIFDKAIVKNGSIVPGKIMKLTLSCDHRVVDGATGAKFLQTLKQYLEEPVRLLL